MPFDPNEPRDYHGRWTAAGSSTGTLALPEDMRSKINKSIEAEKANESNKNIEDNVNRARSEGLDSFSYYRDSNGDWIPERQALHDRILNEELSNGSVNYGTVFMTGGATANGKTTMTDSLNYPNGILKINPDDYKEKLPENAYLRSVGDKGAASFVHEESSYLSKKAVDAAMGRNYDIVYDTIGDGSLSRLTEKVDVFKSAGKRVVADYATLDTDLSLKLAEQRGKRTGRFVAESVIIQSNKAISELVPRIIENKLFNEFRLWDTNINKKPRLVISQINGETTIHDKKLYDDFLKKKNYGTGK